MKLLLWGDLAATGFGTVTSDLGRALLDRGTDVRFVSFNESGVLEEPFKSRTLVMGGPDGWLGPVPDFHSSKEQEVWAQLRRDSIASLFTGGMPGGWTPDATIIVGDPASLTRSGIADLIPASVPAYHYVPIEGVGLPPSWAALWTHLQPVAMSEFGAGEIETLTGIRPPVVYHGVDADAFYPVSATRPIMMAQKREWLRSRDECKAHLGIDPKATVLFRADRFVPRKRFGSMLRAVAQVMMHRPDVVLLLHCRTIDEGGNLADFCSHLPPQVVARIRSTGILDAGLVADRKLLNVMYNAADLYLSTGAEGFGLTLAESLACGTPVLGMDYSSVPEVIGEAGVTVPVGYHVENEYAYYWANVDEAAYAQELDALVADRGRRRLLGAKGPHQVRQFSWAHAAGQFLDLASVQQEIAA